MDVVNLKQPFQGIPVVTAAKYFTESSECFVYFFLDVHIRCRQRGVPYNNLKGEHNSYVF